MTESAATETNPSEAALVSKDQKQQPLSPWIKIKTLTDPRIIERLRILDKYCFPVSYGDRYYENLLPGGIARHTFNQIAYYNDCLVGACTCRLEESEFEAGKSKCYVMTLGVLEPYRHMGIASALLNQVMDNISKEQSVVEICLHVQTTSDALKFYTEKFNFVNKEKVESYYHELDNNDAFYLYKKIVHVVSEKNAKKKK